ncbi:hypothetical protein CIRG_07942 [Coccidioides immitis RMSCC 2394]|uniref:Uncharacterized protein n=1 Tax=Coccidioides immitis RMSCC 2394 TaxID=404692 RepID=A0A0J6YHV1_COCIT|nr:hypothetical protein CIRG_07942 [Coccidioides immitis RMSCC 2394]
MSYYPPPSGYPGGPPAYPPPQQQQQQQQQYPSYGAPPPQYPTITLPLPNPPPGQYGQPSPARLSSPQLHTEIFSIPTSTPTHQPSHRPPPSPGYGHLPPSTPNSGPAFHGQPGIATVNNNDYVHGNPQRAATSPFRFRRVWPWSSSEI